MDLRQIVPIYLIDVQISIYQGKAFIKYDLVKNVVFKGFGRNGILKRREELERLTAKFYTGQKGQSFKVKDVKLISQHGFGVKDF